MHPLTLLLLTAGAAAAVELNGLTFEVADGYTLSLAAPSALAARPVEACFDDRGRLYVTESSGSNAKVDIQQETRPHRLLRLEDTDGDGVFDRRTVFADGLMFPEGVLWHQGAVYVAAPPQIWKFTDPGDDGTADRREVWYDGKTLTGCANDLHGPYAGPDGLLYWCKGAFAAQTHDLPGQNGWTSRASHVFRMKPDGTDFDCVFTAGMDNPVGLAWLPEGDLIVSGTFLQHPGDGKRDGLIHAVRGGLWGKDHDVLAGHPRTGPLLPAMTHLGPAAPCGIARYGRDLLVAQFNLRKVSRHVLEPSGATWQTADSDFLTCGHPDFHPTDVLQAPDGSVLVVDTGGWYKLCCPTSQAARPEVTGAIYRLRKTGGEVPVTCSEPRWKLENAASVAALLAQLQSPSLHLRRLAVEALSARLEPEAAPALSGSDTEAIAEALPRAADLAEPDRFLQHAVSHALLHPAMAGGVLRVLRTGRNPLVLRAALPAFRGGLTPEEESRLLAFPDPQVQQSAASWLSRGRVLAWLQQELTAGTPPEQLRIATARMASGSEAAADMAALLPAAASPAARLMILGEMEQALTRLTFPAAWAAPLLPLATGDDLQSAVPAARLLAAAPPDTLPEPARLRCRERLTRDNAPPALRLELMRCLSPLTPDEGTFRELTETVRTMAGQPEADTAAALLGKAQLTAGQLHALIPLVETGSFLQRPLLLRAYAKAQDEALGLALVDRLAGSGALHSLAPSLLGECLGRFPGPVQQRLRSLQSPRNSATDQARLDAAARDLPDGDAARGKVVFQSAKAACVLCHQAGYFGKHLGPDLSKIGSIRTRRDLLEAILFPSASFVRSYEPVEATRKSGPPVYGILANESASGYTLTTGPVTPPVFIDRRDLTGLTPGTASLMPQGIDQILTPQELADVLSFLMSLQ